MANHESLYYTTEKRSPRGTGCAAPGFLTRVQLHLRLQGMGHELYRSADFLPVQIYIYTKVTLPFPSASQNGCQIRSHQKLCFGSTRDKPNMTSCHTQREHRSSILISLIMQQRLVWALNHFQFNPETQMSAEWFAQRQSWDHVLSARKRICADLYYNQRELRGVQCPRQMRHLDHFYDQLSWIE